MKKVTLLFTILIIHLTTFAQQANNDGILRVLAIGNSFSEDAIENYLFDLAKAANKKIIIGNLYIGGASVELHVNNASANKSNYAYRKTTVDGQKESKKDISIETAIQDEKWDYISLQQASPYSGQYEVIMKHLPLLIDYVKSKAPGAKLIYHQTWAYQQDSAHKGFANYDNNQRKMYDGIIEASKKINDSKIFAFVVPSGTAVQNARTSSKGDHYTRDGFHLELNYGRFTAACTWYEKLFGLDPRKNTWKPEKVTDVEAQIAKEAAHKAVKKPFKVSIVKR